MADVASNSDDFAKNDHKPLTRSLEDVIPDDIKNAIEELPTEERTKVKELIAVSIKKSWRGPLPSPDTLREYDAVIKGGAERLFNQFEKQSSHRMELEKLAISSELTQSKNGQIFGFSIAILFLLASVYLIATGHDVAGTVIGSIDLVALVSVFVYGKVSQKKELEEKK